MVSIRFEEGIRFWYQRIGSGSVADAVAFLVKTRGLGLGLSFNTRCGEHGSIYAKSFEHYLAIIKNLDVELDLEFAKTPYLLSGQLSDQTVVGKIKATLQATLHKYINKLTQTLS
jgi:hypothetical protein